MALSEYVLKINKKRNKNGWFKEITKTNISNNVDKGFYVINVNEEFDEGSER